LIPSDRPHLIISAQSHPGIVRENNEDRYSVTHYTLEQTATPSLLAIVADGIGGHQAGEIAAQLTLDTIIGNLGPSDGQNPVAELRTAITRAGQVVSQAAHLDKNKKGMGSTTAIAWLMGSRLFIASVGDSRIYLRQRGKLRQINIDHTWVQEAIDYKIIQPDQAQDHPQAHVLRRYIGSHQAVEPDLLLRLKENESPSTSEKNQGLELQRGDQVLLCTDGLTDLVADDEIYRSLRSHPPDVAVSSLIDLACERGGHDNITIVLITIPLPPRPRGFLPSATWAMATALSIVGMVCLISLALAAGWWFGIWPWASGDVTSTTLPTPTIHISTETPALSVSATETPLPSPTPSLVPTVTLSPVATSTPYPLPTVEPTSTTVP
jgi:protein phosphatase